MRDDESACEPRTRIGLVGAGQMARALARGWRRPILCTDAGSGRAAKLVAEVGGEVVPDLAALANRADIVVLCHKPTQLAAVARNIDGLTRAAVSVLSAVTLTELREAYSRTPVLRVAVNLPVEVRAGVISLPPEQGVSPELEAEVAQLFGQLGTMIRIPEPQMGAVISLAGVGPALLSVVAEAQADAAIRAGLSADLATMLASQTLIGTGALLAARGHDTLALRRAVSSPGGLTARSLAALEANGLRHAISASFSSDD
ncbi:MAG: pyrroline-5-carboxylate reductase family protein [Streptosporangiaceae bacterium]